MVNALLAMQAESGWLGKVTGAWQAAKISNLDYLLYCNLAAARSFNDLTQVGSSATETLEHKPQQIGIGHCYCQPLVSGRQV